jgi:hypothetical protein
MVCTDKSAISPSAPPLPFMVEKRARGQRTMTKGLVAREIDAGRGGIVKADARTRRRIAGSIHSSAASEEGGCGDNGDGWMKRSSSGWRQGSGSRAASAC